MHTYAHTFFFKETTQSVHQLTQARKTVVIFLFNSNPAFSLFCLYVLPFLSADTSIQQWKMQATQHKHVEESINIKHNIDQTTAKKINQKNDGKNYHRFWLIFLMVIFSIIFDWFFPSRRWKKYHQKINQKWWKKYHHFWLIFSIAAMEKIQSFLMVFFHRRKNSIGGKNSIDAIF